ncbi:MAG: nucleoside 2-deoxyribosyltransferase [Anaerolineae bacterium]|nr:nucleoside 2-deoxyribosyltransferase [Anaerolineae bacterium]
MQAYLAIKYHPDSRNRERIERIIAALAAHGIGSICIARDVEQWGTVQLDAPTLMQCSFAAIDTCDMMIVDLTEKGVGTGIEAGYAYAHQIPIITIAQTGADISETLLGISSQVYSYHTYDDLVTFLKDVEDRTRMNTENTDQNKNPTTACTSLQNLCVSV